MSELALTILPETAADAPAIERLHERTFGPGDCVLQPPGIVHNELECSDDVEVLEIYSPAVHETVVADKMPEAATAH